MKSIAITPSLFLGPPEQAVLLSDLLVVTTADEALHWIKEGGSARLPSNAWDAAREVLQRLGSDDAWIDKLFAAARGEP